MTTNRFVKGQPSASVSEPIRSQLPTKCEIPGCKTLYLGKNGSGEDQHRCGKADVFVDDRFGNKRGVCAEHYTRQLVADGLASNQDLVDYRGAYDLAKVKAFRDSQAQLEFDETTKRQRLANREPA